MEFLLLDDSSKETVEGLNVFETPAVGNCKGIGADKGVEEERILNYVATENLLLQGPFRDLCGEAVLATDIGDVTVAFPEVLMKRGGHNRLLLSAHCHGPEVLLVA